MNALPQKKEGSLYKLFIETAGNPNTCLSRQRGIEVFSEYLGVSPDQLAAKLIETDSGIANVQVATYKARLIAAGASASTVNSRLYAIRSFLRYLRIAGKIVWTIDIKSVKQEGYRDTRGPLVEEVSQMLITVDNPRDEAILLLAFCMGLRRAEIASLDVGDIEGDYLLVKGKGRHERKPFRAPPRVLEVLNRLLKANVKNSVAIFCNKKGGRLSHQGIYRVVKRYGDKIGLKTSPHGLRHSAATRALEEENGNIIKVQHFTRHEDVATVIKYNDNRLDDFGEIAEKLSKLV